MLLTHCHCLCCLLSSQTYYNTHEQCRDCAQKNWDNPKVDSETLTFLSLSFIIVMDIHARESEHSFNSQLCYAFIAILPKPLGPPNSCVTSESNKHLQYTPSLNQPNTLLLLHKWSLVCFMVTGKLPLSQTAGGFFNKIVNEMFIIMRQLRLQPYMYIVPHTLTVSSLANSSMENSC